MSSLLDQAKSAASTVASTASNLASQATTAAQPALTAASNLASQASTAAQPALAATTSAVASAAGQAHAAAAPYLPTALGGVDAAHDFKPSSGEGVGSAKVKLEGLLAERPKPKELQDKGILKGAPDDSLAAQKAQLMKAQLESDSRTTIISSPGKVLLAGGYLVLDPEYTGTVVATSSRFYTCIRTVPASSTSSSTASTSTSSPSTSTLPQRILVKAPQFLAAQWSFLVSETENGVTVVVDGEGDNKFVRLGLEKTLGLVKAVRGAVKGEEGEGGDLEVVIVGDNDFYSQRRSLEALSLPPTLASLSSLPPFTPLNTTLSDVHKTGLGSSAALITSLVGGLMVHFGLISTDSLLTPLSSDGGKQDEKKRHDLDFIHNTAQYIHCLAQGKIGSGFDVSSAVYGSQVYRRFGEGVLGGLMGGDFTPEEMVEVLVPSNKWTNKVDKLDLPPQLRLLLADVDAGSDTPSFVGRVLKWRKQNPDEAQPVYENLKRLNDTLSTTLRKLCALAEATPAEYGKVVSELYAGQSASTGEIGLVFSELGSTTKSIRQAMKQFGEAAGVPIEPDEQTRLLNACCAVQGVIGGGVPGAGGFDALYLLILDPPSPPSSTPSPITEIETIWASWKELSVCPLSSRADEGGLRWYKDVGEVEWLGVVCGW